MCAQDLWHPRLPPSRGAQKRRGLAKGSSRAAFDAVHKAARQGTGVKFLESYQRSATDQRASQEAVKPPRAQADS